jgi:hypothetical protein
MGIPLLPQEQERGKDGFPGSYTIREKAIGGAIRLRRRRAPIRIAEIYFRMWKL